MCLYPKKSHHYGDTDDSDREPAPKKAQHHQYGHLQDRHYHHDVNIISICLIVKINEHWWTLTLLVFFRTLLFQMSQKWLPYNPSLMFLLFYLLFSNQLHGHPTSPNLHYHHLQGHPHFLHFHHAPLQGPPQFLHLISSYSNLLTPVHLRTTTSIHLRAIHLPGCPLMA